MHVVIIHIFNIIANLINLPKSVQVVEQVLNYNVLRLQT